MFDMNQAQMTTRRSQICLQMATSKRKYSKKLKKEIYDDQMKFMSADQE